MAVTFLIAANVLMSCAAAETASDAAETAGDAALNAADAAQPAASPLQQTSGTQLTGKVNGGTPQALSALHDLGVTCHHLHDSLKGMLYEVQRQDMVVVGEPDVIGPMVIPAIPNPSGMLSMGYLPPRKKWVDFLMGQINSLYTMLQSELSNMPRPDVSTPQMQDAYLKLNDSLSPLEKDIQALRAATSGPDYKNREIGIPTSSLYESVDRLNKDRKKLFHMIKEQSKGKRDH